MQKAYLQKDLNCLCSINLTNRNKRFHSIEHAELYTFYLKSGINLLVVSINQLIKYLIKEKGKINISTEDAEI